MASAIGARANTPRGDAPRIKAMATSFRLAGNRNYIPNLREVKHRTEPLNKPLPRGRPRVVQAGRSGVASALGRVGVQGPGLRLTARPSLCRLGLRRAFRYSVEVDRIAEPRAPSDRG